MNVSFRVTRSRAVIGVLALCLVFAVSALAGEPDWYKNDEQITNSIATNAQRSTPYPTNEMSHFLERDNLKRRLLAFNKADKVGYLYVMSFGKFVGYYTVKGKVSSTQSQLTVTDQTWDTGGNNRIAVPSMGDDGSYGPNEGGDRGIFFFTTGGVLVETSLDWLYSDQPLHIDAPNLLK